MRRMHAHESSGIRGRLYFVLNGQQRHWQNYIDGRLVLAFAIRIYTVNVLKVRTQKNNYFFRCS